MLLDASSLVLVAVMNNLRDLEIARLLGWYRIPLRTAPKVVTVDYLAFYQTQVFGSEGSCIQYVAAVRGNELTTRAELLRDEPDHPHAREEYYKIQIGPLESLPHPILAEKWRRITFLYTIGEYLLSAQTINDLVVQSEERQTLWQALRERASQANNGGSMLGYANSGASDLPEFDVDPRLVALLLGIREAGGNMSTPSLL